ncbi:hypothetical protein PPL_05368 [Heterostelium album PN500]|uniref:Uncharacterized protein n=1 Tax=Heterostelium pallidum (strain ATCC 26659 / Pp 5 / PN500) TaxID=670386 RepID=D3B9Z7_HETP5|nr:hypothetical protein PPL_05368 [Heterostelium album PN500]EFA81384.1 hypothetical protein PPL_05368 [Heterostelium album PN500]|eukprot:XP_020433502.1 hypothetical protein PPL_05368 [Heterostelium album PN500]
MLTPTVTSKLIIGKHRVVYTYPLRILSGLNTPSAYPNQWEHHPLLKMACG